MALQDWESVRTGTKLGEGTVVFIGAGASKHLGLPLADELLAEMFTYAKLAKWRPWGGHRARKDLFDFLKAIYPSFKGDKQRSPSLEYFLSLIDAYQLFIAKGVMEKEDQAVNDFKTVLLQILVDYMWNRMRDVGLTLRASPYYALASRLSTKDTIVSLNWDLAFEWAFHYAGRGSDWSYLAERSKIPILKLHGSINWRPQKGLAGEHPQSFYAVGPDVEYWEGSGKAGIVEEGYLSRMLNDIPVIIPPSHYKAMENNTLRRVWQDAYDRLLCCKRIIIVGCSFREEDRHLYSLFSLIFRNWKDAVTSRNKIVKVVGPRDVAKKFRRNIFPKCDHFGNRFEAVKWTNRLFR